MYTILLQTISLSFVTRYNRNLYTAWNCQLDGGNPDLACALQDLTSVAHFLHLYNIHQVKECRPHCTWNECLTWDICQYKTRDSTVQPQFSRLQPAGVYLQTPWAKVKNILKLLYSSKLTHVTLIHGLSVSHAGSLPPNTSQI